MGLLLGLQIGVTFSEIRGYTFGFFGGRIEGEGKGWFLGVRWGKLPICDIGKMGANRAKTLYLWGFLYDVNHKRGGYTPHRVSGGALLQADNTNDEGYGIDVLVWKFKGVIIFVV